MKNVALAQGFFESVMGPLDEIAPQPLSGWEYVEHIWPLNDVFRPHIERIRSVRYRPRYESGADRAVEAFVERPVSETWHDLNAGVWRVLLERHMQMLTVALTNDANGNEHFTFIPAGLPKPCVMPGLMLLWLHSTELPSPPKDRSTLELPAGAPPAPIRPQ